MGLFSIEGFPQARHSSRRNKSLNLNVFFKIRSLFLPCFSSLYDDNFTSQTRFILGILQITSPTQVAPIIVILSPHLAGLAGEMWYHFAPCLGSNLKRHPSRATPYPSPELKYSNLVRRKNPSLSPNPDGPRGCLAFLNLYLSYVMLYNFISTLRHVPKCKTVIKMYTFM